MRVKTSHNLRTTCIFADSRDTEVPLSLFIGKLNYTVFRNMYEILGNVLIRS